MRAIGTLSLLAGAVCAFASSGCSSSKAPNDGETPPSPAQAIVNSLNAAFANGPAQWGATSTTTISAATNLTLANAGVSLHEWDSTEYLPAPWIQKEEQGHTDADASAGIVNNLGRTSNLPNQVQTGPDGVISVYTQDFGLLPELGGVIYNTTLLTTGGAGLVDLICSYDADAGDDSRGELGCGCPETQSYETDCAAYIADPSEANCTQQCQNQCTNCNNVCKLDGSNAGQCAYPAGEASIPWLMQATVTNCATMKALPGGIDCYNEILVDVRAWTTKDGSSPPKYTALPAYFPQVIWAFSYVKNYGQGGDPVPLAPVPLTEADPSVWQAFTTRAWYNFNKLYPTAAVPLVELDVIASATPAAGVSSPFSLVCASMDDTSAACLSALKVAGLNIAELPELVCDPGCTPCVVSNANGVYAACAGAQPACPDPADSCSAP